MSERACHCLGFDGDCECEHPATEEDGLCDSCRCEHGCCTDHGSPSVGLDWVAKAYERDRHPEAWLEKVMAAYNTWDACRSHKGVVSEHTGT